MNWSLRFSLASILSSIHACSTYTMLFTGSVVLTPDQTRYIALLGHHHQQTGQDIEARQLDELVAICKQGVAEGKKFHILYERAGDAVQRFVHQKSILIELERAFESAAVPDCLVENVEIRDVGNAAYHIFNCEGNVLSDETRWNEGSKQFNELTFEDLFDEFEEHANELEPSMQQLVQEHPECPQAFLIEDKCADARRSLEKIRKFLQETELPFGTMILSLARERQGDCGGLAFATSNAFSHLFDLVIFRRLMQLDLDSQPIVIAGASHTLWVEQLACGALMWKSGLSCSNAFAQAPMPLDYRSLRSIILNESEWMQVANDTLKYLLKLSVASGKSFQALHKSIFSNYCKQGQP